MDLYVFRAAHSISSISWECGVGLSSLCALDWEKSAGWRGSQSWLILCLCLLGAPDTVCWCGNLAACSPDIVEHRENLEDAVKMELFWVMKTLINTPTRLQYSGFVVLNNYNCFNSSYFLMACSLNHELHESSSYLVDPVEIVRIVFSCLHKIMQQLWRNKLIPDSADYHGNPHSK